MTPEDCWLSIEQYTLDGDWNGLLVCADALQEQGLEEVADTIRWAGRREYLPFRRTNAWVEERIWGFAIVTQMNIATVNGPTCHKVWLNITDWRRKMLKELL